MGKKLLDFQASISDVKQINPLFSTCRVRVLYTGRNRNMSILTKAAVEKALPTLKNIPIIGEFNEDAKDFKGHGGTIDLDTYKFVPTTKPYGVVPESATYSWEEVKGTDGSSRDYLTIEGCYLWTGRYEEANRVIEKGAGQSMEIEVTEGIWNEEQEAYQIDNFIFSALCILGDEVDPAFEDANITAYSLADASFQLEFSNMLSELDSSLTYKKEVQDMDLKELLAKYSTTAEDLTEKGLNFEEIPADELEAKIAETLEVEVIADVQDAPAAEQVDPAEEAGIDAQEADAPQPTNEEDSPESVLDAEEENLAEVDAQEAEPKDESAAPETVDPTVVADASDALEEEAPEAELVDVDALKNRIVELEGELAELDELRTFKKNIEKVDHEEKVQKLFSDFQFTEEDVQDLDIHAFSYEEIEEKCFMIFGRKVASKKNFSKQATKEEGIRVPLSNEQQEESVETKYGGLLKKQ